MVEAQAHVCSEIRHETEGPVEITSSCVAGLRNRLWRVTAARAATSGPRGNWGVQVPGKLVLESGMRQPCPRSLSSPGRANARHDLVGEQLQGGLGPLRTVPGRIVQHERGQTGLLLQLSDAVGDSCGRAVNDGGARQRIIVKPTRHRVLALRDLSQVACLLTAEEVPEVT